MRALIGRLVCLDESMKTPLWRFRFARVFKKYFIKAIEHLFRV